MSAYVVPKDSFQLQSHPGHVCVSEEWLHDLLAERDLLKRGGKTLGEIVDRQCRDVIEATGSQDIIGEDGDGDWENVWERLHEMRATIDQLTAQRDDARRLALPAFTSPEGDLSEHTHVLDSECRCPFVKVGGQVTSSRNWSPNCPVHKEPSQPRPSAYDMPVGSVVRTNNGDTYTRESSNTDGWTCSWTDKGYVMVRKGAQNGWIEGLFSDGLVTEWRLP